MSRSVWPRRLWVAAVAFTVMCAAGGFVTALTAAALSVTALGNVAAVLIVSALVGGIGLGIASDTVPERNLPKADRRRLETKRRRRILLDGEIRRLEWENEVGGR